MVFRTDGGKVLVQGALEVRHRRWGRQSPTEQTLGARQFETVRALGRKTTSVIPTGQIGNDRPIEVTDERGESPELRMLIYSVTPDPRTGVVVYRLTNINRAEPPADLFTIPLRLYGQWATATAAGAGADSTGNVWRAGTG